MEPNKQYDLNTEGEGLFSYALNAMKVLSEEEKKQLFEELKQVLSHYRRTVDLTQLGFPENYEEILKEQI